jgi:hypothetical protein
MNASPARKEGLRTMRNLIASVAIATGLLLAALPGSAAAADRNHDGIPDRWEKRHGLTLKVNQAKRDQDRDQLVNKREFKFGLDPLDDDSDDDGVEDGDESSGTISAYDAETGVLTITLVGGETVTGLVTEDTEVDCDNGDDQGDEDGDDQGEDGDDQGENEDVDDDEVDDDAVGDKSDGDDGLSDDEGESDDEEVDCSTADLAVGALVQEAELEIEGGVAVWEEIELLV